MMRSLSGLGLFLSQRLAIGIAFPYGTVQGTNVDCGSFSVSGSPDFEACPVSACPGDTISASLCYSDSKCEGDTYLTLHSANRSMVSLNDDYCGVCSALIYTVPASAKCQTYSLRQGCFSAHCSGRTAIRVTRREPEEWDPWYYQNPMNEKGAIVTVWFIEVSLWGCLSLIQLAAHRHGYSSAVVKIGVVKAVLVFSLWFFIDFVLLCARFNFFLRGDNGAEYAPYRLESGELVYLADEFFDAAPQELEDAGCSYTDIVGAHEHSGDYTCSFIYPLGPQLISQAYVQFSIGVQLIIIVFLQFTCFCTARLVQLEQRSSATLTTTALTCLTFACVEFILNLHQFFILLPLTAVLPNPFCAVVQVPVATESAMCLFKIAAAMLPYGVPSVVGGGTLLYFAYTVMKSGSTTNNVLLYILSFVMGAAGLYFTSTGACMIIFWIFGSIILGMWYGLEGMHLSYSTAEIAFILNMMKCTPFLFSFLDIIIFPLPLSDEKSFYHAAYREYQRAKSFLNKLYSSEPCCVDTCAWIWVRISTFELWVSEKVGSCCENMSFWCCQKHSAAQIACEDIVISDT